MMLPHRIDGLLRSETGRAACRLMRGVLQRVVEAGELTRLDDTLEDAAHEAARRAAGL